MSTDERVSWAKQLTHEEAAAYTTDRVLSGTDGWKPAGAWLSVQGSSSFAAKEEIGGMERRSSLSVGQTWNGLAERAAAEIGNAAHAERVPGAGDRPITLYTAGDSTMSEYGPDRYPRYGWGQAFGRFFGPGVLVSDDAASGRSSKSFITEGRLTHILNRIQPGDYLFIQFGHNDQKPDEERHTDPDSTYPQTLRRFIDGARGKGAHPVLITPVQRRSFDEQGSFKDTHGDYPAAVRRLAAECDVPLIDLSERSRELYESLGPEGTKRLLLWLAPGESPNYPEGVQDNTHFCETGAVEIAKLVVQAVRELGLPIAAQLLD